MISAPDCQRNILRVVPREKSSQAAGCFHALAPFPLPEPAFFHSGLKGLWKSVYADGFGICVHMLHF